MILTIEQRNAVYVKALELYVAMIDKCMCVGMCSRMNRAFNIVINDENR
jgi:hypothetical protein